MAGLGVWAVPCLALLAALVAGCGPDRAATVGHYTSLTWLLETARKGGDPEAGGAASIEVWEIERDRRTVISQRAPNRLRIGPIDATGDCLLRFGIALDPVPAEAVGAIRFRVRAELERGSEVVFDETLGELGAWEEREVAIPDGLLQLELSAAAEIGASPRRGGWSAPHVVCRVAASSAEPAERPSIVLISLDTLRADHLGLYGYPRPTSPTLDALGEESLVFDNAFATAPWTLPAHASMFTGLYPDEHRAGHESPLAPLSSEVTTLAEMLRSAGYRTIGVSGGYALGRRSGLARGFDTWIERPRANLASVLPEVYDALGTAPQEPVFLFLHTHDIHGPYNQPVRERRFETEVHASPEERDAWARAAREPHHQILELDRDESLSELVAGYDSGIRMVDGRLAQLFERLRALDLFRSRGARVRSLS